MEEKMEFTEEVMEQKDLVFVVEDNAMEKTEPERVAAEEKKKEVQRTGFWKDDRGVGVIEIVLILVILIGLVLIFKEQITAIVNNAFANITGDAGKIMN